MNDIDHKAEAEAILFADRQYRDERTLMEAQVSATLYLAEQQRVANLIAVSNLKLTAFPNEGPGSVSDLLRQTLRALGIPLTSDEAIA